MRKQVIEHAAFEVATQIRTVEDCIEDALVEIADLQSKMLRARAAAGVATATGHAAFEQLADHGPGAGRRARRNGQLPRRTGRCEAVRPRSCARSASAKATNARRRSRVPICASSPDRLEWPDCPRWSGHAHLCLAPSLIGCCSWRSRSTPLCGARFDERMAAAICIVATIATKLVHIAAQQPLHPRRGRRDDRRSCGLGRIHASSRCDPSASGRCGSPACS